jgi:hypothetical protein
MHFLPQNIKAIFTAIMGGKDGLKHFFHDLGS